jgi:hypothetical protein
MKNASEGETLGIYLEEEGEGEICRGMDLSEGGEENPPRILRGSLSCWRIAPWSLESGWGEK